MYGKPIRYSPELEHITEDETETVSRLNETFDTILEKTAEDYGHAVRSVHAKAHGILEGEMIVDRNLPEELAQGIFADDGRAFKVFLRISTNAGDILPDAISLPRGIALKVVDVDGTRLPDSEGRNQDFLMVNGPVFQTKTAEKFHKSLKMLAATTDRIEGTKKVVSATLRGVNKVLSVVGIESSSINSLGGAPNVEPFGETYFSTTPFRYGDFVAKFSIRPAGEHMRSLSGEEIEVDGRENAIREDLREEALQAEMEWHFCVQLCRDIDQQPIEDPTVEWKEAESPFQKVATIKVAPQDSWDADLVRKVNEEMRFSIWTGIEDHRPLGNINRARKATYRHSADFRAQFNGCPYHEPK